MDAHTDTQNFFSQCITFLNILIETWESNKWESEHMNIECWKWFELLLRNLNMNDGRHHSLMVHLIKSQHRSSRNHRGAIKEYVRECCNCCTTFVCFNTCIII